MAWSYHKRIKIAKEVNLNLSKNNIGLLVGYKGLKMSVSKIGLHQYTKYSPKRSLKIS